MSPARSLTDPEPPVLVFAYAADLVEGEAQPRNLPAEQRLLGDILRPLEKKSPKPLIKTALRTDAAAPELAKCLRDYAGKIAILHFSGYPGDFARLLTTSEDGAAAYEPLSVLLQRQAGLKLVFVSGCLSEPLADELLRYGAPVVAGTLGLCDDSVATALAADFYTELAKGAPVELAFQQAAAAARLRAGAPAAAYRAGAQRGGSQAADTWPWLLRWRPGAEDARTWNIPAATGDYLLGLPELAHGPLPENPYHRALAWYGRQEAEIFFGRGRQIRGLYQRLTAANSSPILLLCGQSGVGKSSLLEAGLIPRLEASHKVIAVRRDRVLGAAGTLRQALALPAAAPDEALAAAWQAQAAGKPLIVVLDQVEEIFTRPLAHAADELESLADACRALFGVPAARPAGRLLLSFRKEYLPEVEESLRRRNLDLAHMLLERLDEQSIVEVVIGPTTNEHLRTQYNLDIERGLAERIARDLSDDAASPIATILQILLVEMWEKARGRNAAAPCFDAALYAELQSSGIMLQDFFRQRVAEFQRQQPEVVDSGLLLDLLHFHTTPQGTAEQRSAAEIAEQYQDVAGLPQIIQRSKDLRLLADPTGDAHEPSPTKDGAGTNTETSTADRLPSGARLAHDTLAPVVQAAYVDSALPGQRARRILQGRIAGAQGHGEDGPAPLDAADLSTVEAGLGGMRRLTPAEKTLLAASRQEQDRIRRRDVLRQRVIYAGTAVILALAVAAAWFGYASQVNARTAEEQRQLAVVNAADAQEGRAAAEAAQATAIANAQAAERQQALAVAARTEAEANLQQAEEQRALAETNARRSKAGELASYVDELLVRSSFDPSLALMLAQAAVDSTWNTDGFVTGNADAALQAATASARGMGWQQTFPAHRHTGPVNTVAFRPDGGAVLTGSADQSLRLWDAATGGQIALLAGHVGPVIAAAFAPDGSWAVSGGDDGRVLQWDTGRGALLVTLAATDSWVRSLAVRGDGKQIAAGLDSGVVLLISPAEDAAADTVAGAEPLELPGHLGKVNSVAFAPQGDQLASAGADGTIRLWNTRTGESIATLPGHAGEAKWVGYAGASLYSAGADGDIKQWDAATGLELGSYQVDTGDLRAAALSADGQYMASVHGDSSVRVWSLADPADVRRFFGHEDATLAVAFSPDGARLVTGGEDNSVRTWSLVPGTAAPAWGGHTGEVRTAIFSPDERTVVTAGHDGTVRVWDVGDGSLVDLLPNSGRIVVMKRYASFSPDGSRIVIGADDGSVSVWEPGGSVRLCAPPTGQAIYSAVFSPDGAAILIAGAEGNLRLLDAANCTQEIRQFSGHTGIVRSALFDAEGERIVSAGEDGTARIWSVATGEEIAPPLVHADWLLHASFSPDGKQVATGSRDRSARIWDVASGELVAELAGHAGDVRSAIYSPDGALLATADQDGSTWLWDTGTWRVVRKLLGHAENVRFAAFSPSGAYLATAGLDGTARVWTVQPPQPPRLLNGHRGIVHSTVVSPDGRFIATAGVDGSAILWNAASGERLRTLNGEGHTIWSLAFSPDGSRLLSGCDDGYLRVWELDQEQPAVRLKVSADPVRVLAFSGDGKLLATAGKDRIVRIWDAALLTNIRLYAEGTATVLAAAFHPDGDRLATVGEDGIISIWSTHSDDKLRTIVDASGWVWALAYSPDGARLAAAGQDGRIRLYDGESGKLMQELPTGQGLVASVLFAHDGQWLFGGGQDGVVRVWDLATGRTIRQLIGHSAEVWTLAISPDGQTLVSAGADQTARLWDADIEAALAAAAAMIQREPPLFTLEEQNLYGLPPAQTPAGQISPVQLSTAQAAAPLASPDE